MHDGDKAPSAFLTKRPIAHRGLHGQSAGVPENTLAAARKAIAAGYAIECDVRLSSDGQVMVFHDPTLERLTGLEGAVSARDGNSLREMRLVGSEETIPTLENLLDLVDGAVPLVIELKADGMAADALAGAVARLVRSRPTNIALMSFAHWQLRQLRACDVTPSVGLVATGTAPRDIEQHRGMLTEIDFVSFNVEELDNAFCREVCDRGLPLLCWTVRSPEQAQWAYRYCDQITFEGFNP